MKNYFFKTKMILFTFCLFYFIPSPSLFSSPPPFVQSESCLHKEQTKKQLRAEKKIQRKIKRLEKKMEKVPNRNFSFINPKLVLALGIIALVGGIILLVATISNPPKNAIEELEYGFALLMGIGLSIKGLLMTFISILRFRKDK